MDSECSKENEEDEEWEQKVVLRSIKHHTTVK